jgi:hypothetical protein
MIKEPLLTDFTKTFCRQESKLLNAGDIKRIFATQWLLGYCSTLYP